MLGDMLHHGELVRMSPDFIVYVVFKKFDVMHILKV